MLNKEILEAINKQISREMYSSNLYLSMASYFSSLNLTGTLSWMKRWNMP
jgi:ferritin